MSMKVECLICLRDTAIPKNLNTGNYDGQITCRECGSLMQVKLVRSKVEQRKLERVGHPRLDAGILLEPSNRERTRLELN